MLGRGWGSRVTDMASLLLTHHLPSIAWWRMYKSLRIRGYKSIDDSGEIPLGPITIAIGRNNTGKSALVRAPYLLQDQSIWQNEDIRIGHGAMSVDLTFDELPSTFRATMPEWVGAGRINLKYTGPNRTTNMHPMDAGGDSTAAGILHVPNKEPYSPFFPVLSGRRPGILS